MADQPHEATRSIVPPHGPGSSTGTGSTALSAVPATASGASPDPQLPAVGDAAGLGGFGAGAPDILTLPPIDELGPQVPISPATGQPRRSKVMVAGMAFLYASAVAAAASFVKSWWETINVQWWPFGARMFRWAHVQPSSWQAVLLAVALSAIGAITTAAPAIAGFNAWNGYRWSRWAGLVAMALTPLCILTNNLGWLALPLAAIGTALLFTPPVTRYFRHWTLFRAGEPLESQLPEHVVYGPLPRYA